MTFESLTLTPFCLEKSSVRKGTFNVLVTFPARCMLNSGKICKNNDHTCLFAVAQTDQFCRRLFINVGYKYHYNTKLYKIF